MKTIYVCHCGSPRIMRDAYVSVNDRDDVREFDNVICDDCGYDGHSRWHQVEVEDNFDIGRDRVDPATLSDDTREYL